MSSRKPGYVVGILLLAVVMTAPQILAGAAAGYVVYMTRSWPFPTPPGMGIGRGVHKMFSSASLWQDKLTLINDTKAADGTFDCVISMKDPETGETSKIELTLPDGSHFQNLMFGDRLWLTRTGETYEVVDGALKESPTVIPVRRVREHQRFLWNGDPAIVEQTPTGFAVSIAQNDAWKLVGNVVFPDFGRERSFAGSSVPVTLAPLFSPKSSIEVYNSGDDLHVFLQNDGRLLYHKGLELDIEQSATPIPTVISNTREEGTVQPVGATDETNSIREENNDEDLTGWSLVRELPAPENKMGSFAYGLVIDGQPAALIVDDVASGNAVGHIYQFDGTTWSESASQRFPFGSYFFRTLTSRDGQRSYAVVTTTTQMVHAFALELTGIRKINGLDRWQNLVLMDLAFNGTFPLITLVLGIVLSAGIWILMRWYTKPDYEFGTHTVKLASVGWRGIARLIDLGLIGVTTVGLGWLMTQGLDWLTLAESLNLHVDHPTVRFALKVTCVLAIWLVAVVSAGLFAQAAWGITPGKWLCRLRTVRTSLRPIGFARSFAREIMFFVDCGHFLCWTPGIVSIACTGCRQRLGDLVADTIVIESRSLK